MLNTLKTNLILTRAVLIALFAGLFILAACGGGSKAAAPIVEEDPDEVVVNACDNNPFGTTCTRPEDAAARATAITDCATSIDTKANQRDCGNVPRAVANCLLDPLATTGSRACDATAYETARQGAGVTLAVLEDTRVGLCREGSNRDDLGLCTNAVVQNCDGDVSPFDLLCGRLNPARDAIIEKCVNGATLADSTKNADCVAARAVGFTCFDNPWAESCLTSTMYREFAAFRADAQEGRLEYCMGDDADAGVCGPALARVCSASGDGANPFSDLCMATNNTYDSVRMAFATNCSNGGSDGADCSVEAFSITRVGDDTLCGNGSNIAGMTPDHADCATSRSVQDCVDSPFSTDCREVATFAGARSAFVTNCFNDEFNAGTNGADCTVDAFSITRVGDEALCGNGDDIPGNNPTDPTCATSRSVQDCVRAPFDKDCKDNDIFAGARAGLITHCTRVDSQFTIGCGQAGLSCISNPFDTSQGVDCEEQFGSEQAVTDAQNNLITHCTGADASNQRCVTNVMGTDVATCLANPFTDSCDMTLGGATQAETAQNNLIALCTGEGADGMNTLCTTLVGTTACIANPFDAACDTALGSATQAETAQNNIISLCTGADADGTNALCMTTSAGMAVADCLANPFGNACETTLGATQAETAQNNLIEVCTGVDVDGSNTRCMIATDTEVTACFTNPFGTGCDTELGDSLATAQNNLIEICSGDGADGTNARCTIATDNELTACLRDPFSNLCAAELGATQAMTAQSNLLALCTAADSDNFRTNTLCTDIARDGGENTGNLRVEACLDNPFRGDFEGHPCETALGGADAVARAQANLSRFCFDGTPGTMIYTELCTDALKTSQFCHPTATGGNPFHAYCEDVAGIDEALVGERALFCAETANASDSRCAAYTTCNTNPFGSDCFAEDNIYGNNRDSALTDCTGATDKSMEDDCALTVNGTTTTVTQCQANPFLADCAGGAFDDARTSSFDACEGVTSNRESDPLCMGLIIKAEVTGQNAADAVTVASCIADPFSADCTDDVFDDTRTENANTCNGDSGRTVAACLHVIVKAADSSNNVTVATCTDNPFASGCETLEVFATRRNSFLSNCNVAGDKTTDANCIAPIGSTTVEGCRNTNPFHADCVSLDTFAGARCTANPFYADCLDNESYDGARCTADPFYMDCAMDTALDDARDAICMVTDAGIFNANCTETAYTGTNAARKTFADECRTKPTTTTGCDRAVSDVTDAPTIADCNTNPYTTGCDATIFADALTAYCADGAATIFDTNCDSRAEIEGARSIEEARSVAIGACVAVLTTDKTNTLCADRVIVAGVEENTQAGTPAIPAVTVGSCLDDPFHTACNSNPLFQFARDDHMEVCMSNGNAILPSCAAIAAAEPCVANPFLADCMNATTGHRYRNARLARYAFCQGERAGGSTALTALCEINGEEAGSTIQNEICAYDGVSAFADRDRFNPFSSVCGANASAKIDYCGNGDNRNTQADCKNSKQLAEVALGCLENPFAAACTGDSTINAAVKTRITAKRVAYCLAVDAEGFDATLCNIDDAVGVENEICGSQGANANPFAALCTLDDADFATQRATFVEACGALTGGATRLGANADGATCAPEVIACYATPFMAGTGATDCLNEPAYAMARQGVVDRCVIAFNGNTHVGNADCNTIVGVGQLECITTNPYLNRAEVTGGGVTTPALNCAGNSSYDAVRTALESDAVCNADGSAVGSDARCGIVLVSLCGSGTTSGGDLAIGADPFNAKFCLDDNNRANYVDQREKLVTDCVLDPMADGCTTQINACIADPFLVDGIATGVHCDDDRFKVAFQARTITYCGIEASSGVSKDMANISLEKCQMFAAANTCVANPFGSTCDDAMLGGATGALTTAQTLRATYCATLGTSDAIRVLADESVCRGAVSQVCKGDALFNKDTAGYDCFNDKDTYNGARETHYDACILVKSAREAATTDCALAKAEICTTPTGLQTNPFAPICSEDSVDASAEQLAVVTDCEGLNTTQRAEAANIRCRRTEVANILTMCLTDPRQTICTPYAGNNQPYATERLARYVSDCAGTGTYTASDLCPEQLVKDTICLNSTAGANARPFATICTETSGGSNAIAAGNLKTSQEAVLVFCQMSGNSADDRCTASNSATAILAVCGSAADKNPFDTTTITGFGTGVNCNAYDAFDTDRTEFENACQAGTDGNYTKSRCTTAISNIVTTVCGSTLSAKSNPFNEEICDDVTGPNTTAKETLAAACVNQNAGTAVTGGAICIQTTRDCATNPFGTNCTNAGYNKQKTAVLDACKVASATSTGSGTNARCTAAIALPALICLKDPFSTCADTTLYNIATGTGSDYITEVRTNRLTYCNVNNNINTQKAICRSATQLSADCLQNPFSANCENEIGTGNPWNTYRTTRVNYCKTLNAAQGLASSSSGSATIGNTANVNLCNVAGAIDAVDAICGDTNPATFVAGGQNMNDPFTNVCLQITDYNTIRSTRISNCSTAAFDQNTWACNYAAQATYCDIAPSGDAPTGCPPIQTVTRWRESFGTAVAFSDAAAKAGSQNNFINNFQKAGPDAGLEVIPYNGANATRITDSDLSNVSLAFLSARKSQVLYSCSADNDNTLNSSCSTGTDGITLTGGGTATVGAEKEPEGEQRFYVGFDDFSISGAGSVGAPVFDRSQGSAIWTGQIHWIGAGLDANTNVAAARTGFKMEVDYIAATIQGAVSVNHAAVDGLGRHIIINGDYTTAGVISGTVYSKDYVSGTPYNSGAPNILTSDGSDTEGLLSGIIGNKAAIGVFIGPDISDSNPDSFGGGFIVKPPPPSN